MSHNRFLRSRFVATVGVTALVLATAAACGSDETSEGESSAGSTSSVLHVGQLGTAKVEEALLKASGEGEGMDYSVEYSLFPAGGGGFYEAVPSGAVDLALMADTPPIFGQVAGVEAHIVGVSTSVPEGKSTVEIFAALDSGITSTADLKGKKVALTEGTIMQYTVLKALEEAGLKYSDITPVNLPPADAVTAFQGGDVDAIAALGPQLIQLGAEGAPVVGDGVGTTSGYQVAVLADAAIDDQAKLDNATDYLQRVGRAYEWAIANPEEWTPVYAQTLGIPEELASALVARSDFGWLPIDDDVITGQQAQADAFTELGLIPSALDVSEQFDDRLNDQLVGSDK